MLPYVVKINKRRDNFTLYIGREFAGLPASKWQNPFHEWQYGRADCIRRYEEYVRGSNLLKYVDELSDQALGCWCYPETCHGDVLVKIYKELCKPGIGDMAQAVNVHGNLILPAPLMITSVMGQDGFDQPSKRWAQFQGQLGYIPEEQVIWP